jgi:hypothetical protein
MIRLTASHILYIEAVDYEDYYDFDDQEFYVQDIKYYTSGLIGGIVLRIVRRLTKINSLLIRKGIKGIPCHAGAWRWCSRRGSGRGGPAGEAEAAGERRVRRRAPWIFRIRVAPSSAYRPSSAGFGEEGHGAPPPAVPRRGGLDCRRRDRHLCLYFCQPLYPSIHPSTRPSRYRYEAYHDPPALRPRTKESPRPGAGRPLDPGLEACLG